jgi:hypothetical protein
MPDHGVPGGILGNWLAIFAVIALIYFGCRIVVAIVSRRQGNAATDQPATAAPTPILPTVPFSSIPAGTPHEHIVVIAAAVQAMLGAHRIVHIEPSREGTIWAIEGRWAQQTSHATRR